MKFCVYDDKLLEKYKQVRTKIENLQDIELSSFPIYDDRDIKIKTKTSGNEVYTNFCSLNVSECAVECEFLQSFQSIL